jgi:hypothetical protein
MKILNEILYIVAIISIIIIFTVSGIFAYWWFFSEVPLVTLNTTTIKVDKPIYKPGDTLTYYVEYCKTRSMPMTINRSLVDGYVITFVPVQTDPPVGCHTTISASLKIPTYISTGTYHIEAYITAKINPIKDFYEHWRSIDFIVSK